MNNPKFKLLVTWNVVLTVLLVVVIGIAAVGVQAANDPPVQMYTAGLDHAGGAAGAVRSTDFTVSSTGYQAILSITVNFTGQAHMHQCFVIGSASLINPATGGNTGYRYNFSTMHEASSTGYQTMVVEMSDNPSHDDANYVPVTTNMLYTNLDAASHTFTFVGRKQDGGNPDLIVDNATMSVLCFKKLQTQ